MDRRVRLGRAFLVSLRRLTIAFAAASLLALPSCRRPLGRDATDAGVSPDDGSPSVGDAPRGDILALDAPTDPGASGPAFLGRAVGSSARLASNFFAGTPFSGQVNLLTTGSFDAPQQMFSTDNFARSTAYLALGAPVGDHADWTARAALTQGDIASWIVAGE